MEPDKYRQVKSDKTDSDKSISEPINIKTTTLKINIKTIGDLETKEYDLIPFHPNMSDLIDLSNNNVIFFPSFIKITMKDLQRAGVGQDFPNIFMNLNKYVKLVKYVTSPEREEDNTLIIDKSQSKNNVLSIGEDMMSDFVPDLITIKKDEPITDKEIITNNIGLIKQLLFKPKSRFYILGNEYIIGESKYLPEYVAEGKNEVLSKNIGGITIPMDYVITIQLQLLDAANNPNAGDFTRMSCKAKKANIAKDALDIIGTNFGYKEIQRVSTESILNTSDATKNRKFGKLQKEWEERNKYTKPPTTERERIEQEKKWTPLQRKMAEFEKKQIEYDKIPPLWKKEKDILETNFLQYNEKKTDLNEILTSIKNNNDDKQTTIIKIQAIFPNIDNVEDIVEALLKTKENNAEGFLIEYKKVKEESINDKYTEPFIQTNGLNKDIEDLKLKQANINQQIKTLSDDPSDKYNAKLLEPQKIKIQEALRKKETELEVIKKYKKDIITKWEKGYKLNKNFLKTIKNTKDNADIKMNFETLNKELKIKLSEIVKEKENILVVEFFNGNTDNISKKDIKKYESMDRPLDKVIDLKSNLEELETQYLETAEKINKFTMIQAYIKLKNEELNRYKKFKDDKKEEKGKYEREKIPKNNELRINIAIKKDGEDEAKSRIMKEIEDINKEIDKVSNKIEEVTGIIKEYETHIKKVKEIPETDNSETIYKEYKVKFDDNLQKILNSNTRNGGSNKSMKNTRKVKKYKRNHITQRDMKNKRLKKQTIRRRKNRLRKKKYTLHSRY
jgi:hypothetical protein